MDLHETLAQVAGQVRHTFAHNQLAQGGLLLGALGALAAAARRLPEQLQTWLIARYTTVLEVQGDDLAYTWLTAWLGAQPVGRRLRHLGVVTRYNESLGGLGLHLGTDRDGDELHARLVPLSGRLLLRYRGHWLLVTPGRERVQQDQRLLGFNQTLHFQMLNASRPLIAQLLQDAYQATLGDGERRIEIYTPEHHGWQVSDRRRPRPPESVVYQAGLLDDLLADLRRFQADEDWYGRMGIPYRRGYLLHGPPGNGKSSLVAVLAGALGLPVCVLNLATPDLSDDRLGRLLAALPPRALLLLEDIDAVFRGRERRSETVKLSFAGLLNALDGVTAGEGRVTVLTTNHLEHLDPALVRPGRADRHVWVGHASRAQIEGMWARFYPDDLAGAAGFAGRIPEGAVSMARLQEYLLARRDDSRAAARDWAELAGEEKVLELV